MKPRKTQKNTTLLSIKVFTDTEYCEISKQFSLYDVCHGEDTDF